MFSSNITGQWVNDSWILCSGKECWSYSSKNITIQPQAAIGWKFYANDSNNLWTESEEFFIKEGEKGNADITMPIVIVSVFVIFLAVILLLFTRRKKTKAQKKEEVTYVYRKEDLK
jgi:hypothetical protein